MLILSELVQFVENDSTREDSVKAMASGILNNYFPVANGYTVASKQNRNNNLADFIILRIQRRFPGDRVIVDHIFVEAKRASEKLQASLEQLENALEHANTQFGRCWAIIIHGTDFKFYEYHQNRTEHARLLPWGPPNQSQLQNSFHARNDSVEVEWMLRHMAQNDTPPAR
ncbi:hypothetical protein PITC_024480 [Penicillium italicum]|uniref:Type I restriction enzyme R protein N-terminal domain-containing protein n=1 Tax=Penicillium italicum TaxID=40296 RepID=A0A0A2LAE7_PENIT|nr:hypothetical protein PITC_024480 [Penicillium italicum]